jgi:hypothetical protein
MRNSCVKKMNDSDDFYFNRMQQVSLLIKFLNQWKLLFPKFIIVCFIVE